MELLKKLFAIHSPSGNEKRIRKFIKRWIRSNVPGASVRGDRYGNMYVTKGAAEHYVCLAAHLDQVQRPYPSDYQVVASEWTVSAYSPGKRSRCGLGADDKCGIWIALNVLREADALKVAFFAAEEVGCQGSSNADMSFFCDAACVVEADRRGSSDLITSINFDGLCSKEFLEAIRPELFGYKETAGLMTDVLALRENGLGVSCVNLSCGYYEPHTDNEFVDLRDLRNALGFVRHIVSAVDRPYPHEPWEPASAVGGDDYWWRDDYESYGRRRSYYDPYECGVEDEDWADGVLDYMLANYAPEFDDHSVALDLCDTFAMSYETAAGLLRQWRAAVS